MTARASIRDLVGRSGRDGFLRGVDGVFAMTIDAQGCIGISGHSLETVDALFVFLVDELMAGPASLGLLGHEAGLTNPLDIVDAVAVRTDCGKPNQPFFKKGSPMRTSPVFLVWHFLVDMILDHDVHILMAGGAGQGNVRSVDCRFRVVGSADVVLPVAIPAAGGFFDPSFQVSPAVDAIRINKGVKPFPRFCVFSMANGRAMDIGDVASMGDFSFAFPLAHSMTARAFQTAMDRRSESRLADLIFFVDF